MSVRDALDRSRRLMLPQIIGRSARAHADRLALVFQGEHRTHAQLDERARGLAAVLAAEGVGHGDRVALLLHNGFEFVESLLACHKLGACAVPLNFRLAPDEMRFIVEDAGAVGLIRRRAVRRGGGLAAGDRAVASLRDRRAALRDGRRGRRAARGPGGAARGRPRTALLHVGHHRPPEGRDAHAPQPGREHPELDPRDAGHGGRRVALRPADVPIGGINGLLPFLPLGPTSVITPTTGFDPDVAIGLLEEHAVTMGIFVPTQWEAIGRSERALGMDRRRLRVAMWGASPASRATLELMARTFPDAQIVSAYGQT